MDTGDWIRQNWFNFFSAGGIIASLLFTAFSLRYDMKTRRVTNLLAITSNHREVWKDFSLKPELKRVVSPTADPIRQPVTDAEAMFVNEVILHINSVYYAMNDELVVKYEGLRRDIAEFLALPVPKSVWEKTKQFQNDDFVTFVESCRNWK